MLNCDETIKYINLGQSNLEISTHIKTCATCRLLYLSSSVCKIQSPNLDKKKINIQNAQIEANKIIHKNKMLQNILFISFALIWLTILGLLMSQNRNFTLFYFSISYLILPITIIYSKRKEIFQ